MFVSSKVVGVHSAVLQPYMSYGAPPMACVQENSLTVGGDTLYSSSCSHPRLAQSCFSQHTYPAEAVIPHGNTAAVHGKRYAQVMSTPPPFACLVHTKIKTNC
jgi:hypothetical protein